MRPILLAALLLTVAACRRDSDDSQPPADTPAAAASLVASPAPTETPSATPTARPALAVPAGPSVVTASITYDGLERMYRLYVPGLLAEAPVPLVIGLHGGFGSGEQFANTSRFDAQAEAGRFIAVYPDGTGDINTWNGGRCCGYAARRNVDDVGFIAALVDHLISQYPIDPARVYVVGHSNGAIMGLRLACELSGRIAAVGAVAGSLEVSSCSPSQPVSVLVIHGDADQNHPLEGGQGDRSLANVDFTPVADSLETLRSAMGCASVPSVSTANRITTSDWPGCDAGVTLQLQVIAGASHAWPGGKPGPGLGGEPTDAMDATAVLWEFLAAHSR